MECERSFIFDRAFSAEGPQFLSDECKKYRSVFEYLYADYLKHCNRPIGRQIEIAALLLREQEPQRVISWYADASFELGAIAGLKVAKRFMPSLLGELENVDHIHDQVIDASEPGVVVECQRRAIQKLADTSYYQASAYHDLIHVWANDLAHDPSEVIGFCRGFGYMYGQITRAYERFFSEAPEHFSVAVENGDFDWDADFQQQFSDCTQKRVE